MPSRTLKISESDGRTYGGYLSLPAKKGPALLLLQEVYGVNDDIKGFADMFAGAGYVVLAPDLFWRKAPNLTFAYTDRQVAGDVFREIGGFPSFNADVPPALAALRGVPEFNGGRIGIVGIGLGGITAYGVTVSGLVDAGVSYYPAMLDLASASKLSNPLLLHSAGRDAVAAPDLYKNAMEAFKGNSAVTFERYPEAQHGFATPGRSEYSVDLAKQANSKTIAFLNLHLSNA